VGGAVHMIKVQAVLLIYSTILCRIVTKRQWLYGCNDDWRLFILAPPQKSWHVSLIVSTRRFAVYSFATRQIKSIFTHLLRQK
jgi:hypothetical protein